MTWAVRALIGAVMAVVLAVITGCTSDQPARTYEASTGALGDSLDILGWHLKLSDLRFDSERVLVDVEGSASGDARAKPEDIRFGLYGALAHPIEADALHGCDGIADLGLRPLAAPAPDKLSGTVCLGPQRDQSQVRGVYVYSPRERIAGTTIAYPAAFPVGVLPTNVNDAGVTLKSTSVDAFSADGGQLAPAAMGDPTAFNGKGYMLLGLQIDGAAKRYADDAAARGGPLMVVAGPSLPPPGLSPACSAYGSSVLILPEASRGAVNVRASLCTQGEMNAALLYASVSVIGTHAALWTTGG
ncbi:hypothetical protein ACT17_19460 [Mycolicibacterium conceptionense]|jgi:hypothetical protein|uniref:Uncharacterized protein n=2 Tax=Mycolicibacterium TaxID=1866885 RepID=A0ABR5FWG9_9MYCO|nr:MULTISPECIES: hypothetical protein [Mycolicibacterium]KLI05147.1 hypothetical protein AA982_26070 [Mycolicibacterium senegalense]KLO52287.1 hypothetical protein ABW05_12950 [Mycolicibacterium senegalense]KMV16600.1 hypothetical protein ACT17_19460 [Mycolicibacterium conceptionense]